MPVELCRLSHIVPVKSLNRWEQPSDQFYGRGVGPFFRDLSFSVQWLGATHASDPPVPFAVLTLFVLYFDSRYEFRAMEWSKPRYAKKIS